MSDLDLPESIVLDDAIDDCEAEPTPRELELAEAQTNGRRFETPPYDEDIALARYQQETGVHIEDGKIAIDRRPRVIITTAEHEVTEASIKALQDDDGLFQRGALVRVVREQHTPEKSGIRRPDNAPVIQFVPPANLRERISRHSALVKYQKVRDTFEHAHPPDWLVSGIHCRGEWPGIRPLRAVSDVPILRADGSIHATPGYDAATGVLYEPAGLFAPIPESITVDDAIKAANVLFEPFSDFQFAGKEHKVACLAGLLTALARHAYDGCTPMFLVDGNIRGCGKGLCCDVIANIATGRDMPKGSYVHDDAEMEKRITAIAIAGDALAMLDNISGPFGTASLDRALTATVWKGRVLGITKMVALPLNCVWFGTGNNVQLAADILRRVIHIRMDVLDEKPELKTGFKHPRLLEWVRANRPTLLSAGLTILAGYIRAGRPRAGLPGFGSFEGWSDVVRQAVVWMGMSDPCETRIKLAESADTVRDALGSLLTTWHTAYGERLMVLADVFKDAYGDDPKYLDLRAAIEVFAPGRNGHPPTARSLGQRIEAAKRRVVGGLMLTRAEQKSNRGVEWKVQKVSQ